MGAYVKELQAKYIARMTSKLPIMRAALHLSQANLAARLNISRQQVVAIETEKRKMSWSIFLSLILIFGLDAETLLMMKTFEIYTPELLTLLGSDNQPK